MSKKILTFLASTVLLFSASKSYAIDLCGDSAVSCTSNSIQMRYNEGTVYNYNMYNPNPSAGEPNVYGPKLNLKNASEFSNLSVRLNMKPLNYLTAAPRGSGDPNQRCAWFYNEHSVLYKLQLTAIIDGTSREIFKERISLVGYGFSPMLGGCSYSTNYSSNQIDQTFTLPNNARDIELKIFDADPFIKNQYTGIPSFTSRDYGFVDIKITGI